MPNDLLDSELTPAPSAPLRGARRPHLAAPIVAVALVASGCTTYTIGREYPPDAGADSPDAAFVPGITEPDAPAADAFAVGLTEPDASVPDAP